MVEVLKHGMTCTCGRCSSVLQYKISDIRTGEHKGGWRDVDWEPTDDVYCYIVCPVCHTEIRVKKDAQKVSQHMNRAYVDDTY